MLEVILVVDFILADTMKIDVIHLLCISVKCK